ncbi:hypothetical protein GCM10011403_09930 [Pseudohongiella nitratireducens]|uniref:Dienelactone hydrolase domain-containing protein n=1 Tax=Pseudohongiella nitratireducens TaxID=1768907 RepID=A0A917GS78_9GAMM|nr:alpha/beta hydrolase-fold protein [Pseudohongiella nitratireducens]MDF1622399.1 alpha/beta hydrolase [Pseudohongiella nitratireducens]GGG54849.1 hypothetical protein GCM10011403_09930 [Pseudohongiella nitratireducens]|tara:strand:- start:13960 stop:14694 length:735 start_codon:yes stop_codon:yes gene_type:complete
MKVVPKQILTALFSIALLTLIYSSPASATERLLNITLDDGSDIKVFLFEPDDHGDGPWPLTILISGGTGNEYIARAQFWLGRKLAEHGWAIAVPVSPDSKPFTGENAKRIPKVIAKLQKDEKVMYGKSLLVGVSSGGSAALEIATQEPTQYLGVIAAPGVLRPGLEFDNLHDLPIYLRIAEGDTFNWDEQLPGMMLRLTRANANVDAELINNGSHVFQLDWQDLGRWLDSLKVPLSAPALEYIP